MTVGDLLGPDLSSTLGRLLGQIQAKRKRNDELSQWYDGKKLIRSLGLAVAPEFDALETVVGWPATVIDKLIKRRTIDHVIVPSSAELTDLLRRVWVDNELDLESRMLHTAKGIHGIAFVSVYRREGRTVVLPVPATRMTCDYDRAARRVTAAASDDAPSAPGKPRQATLFLPDRTIVVDRESGGYRIVSDEKNPSGVVPVVRFVNRPALYDDAAWGRSNLTPAVLSNTRSAVRTLMAMEVVREFFSMPKEIALNIDKKSFVDADGNELTPWQVRWGRFLAATGSLDENGEPSALQPDFKQLAASPPTPLIDMLKMYSQMIATDVGFPPSMFGFVTENPPSEGSQGFAEADIVATAEQDNTTDGVQWQRVHHLTLLAEKAVTVRDLPEVQTGWRNVKTYQEAASTDAVSKQVAGGVVPRRSRVLKEKLNYTAQQIERLEADERMETAQAVVAGLADRAAAARATPEVAAAEVVTAA